MHSARSTCTQQQLRHLLALAAMTLGLVAAAAGADTAPPAPAAATAAAGYLDTAAELPAWALPVPYWIFGYLLGPLICMALALWACVALTARWSPLTQRAEAAVFANLLTLKQKKWQICVTKAIVFTAMVCSFTPMTARVFSHWTEGPYWFLTSYWLSYYRINGALITSVYCFELIFAHSVEWDTWLHHAATILMFCISLTQTFIPLSDRPYFISWVIIYGWTSALDFPVYFCMSYYHIATSDQAALKRKYWATLAMCATKCVTIPAMNILPLSYILYNWNNFSWTGTKAILLVAHVPFLLTQILAAMTFYKIMKLNQYRYRCSLAKPVGHDHVSMNEGKVGKDTLELAVGAMEGGMANKSFNTRYSDEHQRTTTGRSSAYMGSRGHSAAMVKLTIDEQAQADTSEVPVPGPQALLAAQVKEDTVNERELEAIGEGAPAVARQLNRLRTFATRTMQVTRVPGPGGPAMARQGSLVQSLNRAKSELPEAAPAPGGSRLLRSKTLARSVMSSFKAAVRDYVDRAVDDEQQATDEDVVKLLNTDVVRLLLTTCVRVAQSSPAVTAEELAEIEQLAVLSGMNK